jgi:subtilase family serine protease
VVSVYVRPRQDAASLPTYEELARTPVLMRTRVTRAELGERLGAAQEDLQVVLDFAKAAELSVVNTDSARRLVQVSGTVGQLSRAFGVELAYYRSDEETYRGHEGPVYLPNAVPDVVEGVFGLDNRRMARRAGAGGGGPVPLTPPQVAQAYDFPTLTNGAKGQTIAILEFSGPTTVPVNLPTCGFSQTDIDGFITHLNDTTGSHLVGTTVTSVTVDESAATPGNVPFANADTVSVETGDPDIEVALDIEVVVSVAQEANVVVYFAPMTEQGWVDAITQIVSDKSNDPSVLSISWGWPELQRYYPIPGQAASGEWPFEWTQQAFNQLTAWIHSAAAIGMTVLVASGDSGSDCDQHDGMAHVSYPGSDPGVISCGGTIVMSTSPLTQGTWKDAPTDGEVTGGGISYLADPVSWQSGANVPVSVNPDHHKGRGIPDVAGNASPNSGYVLWLYGQATTSDYPNYFGPGHPAPISIEGGVGGTSAVAPLYAGLVALINGSLATRVGWLNSMLYELGGGNVFDDINDGDSNSVSWLNEDGTTSTSPGYTSGPGWDACTGWGSLNGARLLQAIAQQAACANLIPSLEQVLVNPTPKFTNAQFAETRGQIRSCGADGFLTPAQVTEADELLAEIESRQHSGGGVPHPGQARS